MTLEEKVKEASDKWQSRYYESNYTLDDNAKFAAGAKWLLSELKPVMDEMRSCIELTADKIASDSYFDPDEAVKELVQALSKYNELFKK